MNEPPENDGGHSSSGRFRPDRTTSIELVQPVRAERSLIWHACAEARGLAGWQADVAEGELDEGAIVTLSWPVIGASAALEIVELDPLKRIVLRNGDARVTLSVSEGQVELVHSGLAESDDLDGLEASWKVALALLSHFCERHPGKLRQVEWIVGRTRCSTEAAHTFFTDEGALSSWLTRRGAIPGAGQPFALELASGAPFTGTVLANCPGRDVCLSWAETGSSALVLRTLPTQDPAERVIALSWSRWTAAPPPRERLEELESAHARLLEVLDQGRWS